MDFLSSISGMSGIPFNYIVPFIFVLTIVVFFHELGHFAVARFFGTKIEAFSIGFGREIFGWNDKHGTRWRVGWLPLGGYVKFYGDENAASSPDRRTLEQRFAKLRPEEKQSCFHFKPLHERAAIVAAGPIANFLLAIVIFAFIFTIVGERVLTATIDEVVPGSAAEEAGILAGDIVLKANGRQVNSFSDLQRVVSLSADTPVTLLLDRDGEELEIVATPRRGETEDSFGNKHKIGLLGIKRILPVRIDDVVPGSAAEKAGIRPGDVVIQIDGQQVDTFVDLQRIVGSNAENTIELVINRDGENLSLTATPRGEEIEDGDGNTRIVGLLGIRQEQSNEDMRIVRYGLVGGVVKGAQETWFVIDRTFVYLGRMIVGKEDADQLGGPIRIAQVSGQVATMGIMPLINLAAILSVSIGLINLFPIPMLDGGHLLYYAYEAVAGKPLNERAQEYGFRIGLALVLCLMIFATWNDLTQLPIF